MNELGFSAVIYTIDVYVPYFFKRYPTARAWLLHQLNEPQEQRHRLTDFIPNFQVMLATNTIHAFGC